MCTHIYTWIKKYIKIRSPIYIEGCFYSLGLFSIISAYLITEIGASDDLDLRCLGTKKKM